MIDPMMQKDDADSPRTAFVIVNYNSRDLSDQLVREVSGCVDRIVVVDNASDEDPGELAVRYPDVDLVVLPANRGYGAGANVGARAVPADVLIVSNPDVSIDASSLKRLVDSAAQPGIGVVGPKLLNPDGTLQRSAYRRDPGLWNTVVECCYPLQAAILRFLPDRHPTLHSVASHERPSEVCSVVGAIVAMKRDAFEAVGGFDEGFFLYREETDLCIRLRAAGWSVRYEPAATAIHACGGSTAETPLATARPAYMESHVRYLMKHKGRVTTAMALVLGALATSLWLVVGPRRLDARSTLAWLLGEGAASFRRASAELRG